MSDGKGNAGRTEAGDGMRHVTPAAQSVREVFPGLSSEKRQHNALTGFLIGLGRDPADAADYAADVIAWLDGKPNKRTAANDNARSKI